MILLEELLDGRGIFFPEKIDRNAEDKDADAVNTLNTFALELGNDHKAGDDDIESRHKGVAPTSIRSFDIRFFKTKNKNGNNGQSENDNKRS